MELSVNPDTELFQQLGPCAGRIHKTKLLRSGFLKRQVLANSISKILKFEGAAPEQFLSCGSNL